MTNNRFYTVGHGNSASSFDVHSETDFSERFEGNSLYHARVLREIDRLRPGAGKRFLLTWNIDCIPITGEDVIVLLLGDERYRIPRYAPHVGFVFKTGGLVPPSAFKLWGRSPLLWAGESLRAWRNRRSARTVRPVGSGAWPVYPIPLGCRSPGLSLSKNHDERPHDVAYAGRLARSPGLRGCLTNLRPSVLSRNWMAAQLVRARNQDNAAIFVHVSASKNTPPLSTEDYSNLLSNSRIAVCPRGNFPETYRLYEAARAGCAVIHEPLNPAHYFDDFPGICVRSWKHLPAIIRELVDNRSTAALGAKARAWYELRASEAAIAGYIASYI